MKRLPALIPLLSAASVALWLATGATRDGGREVVRSAGKFHTEKPSPETGVVFSTVSGSPTRDSSVGGAGFSDLCLELARTDPARAVDLAARAGLGEESDWVMKSLIQTWTDIDAPAALAWIERQPVGVGRDRLLARHAWTLARARPAEAFMLARQGIEAADVREPAIVEIMHEWAGTDLPAAFASWEEIKTEPLRGRVLAELERATGLAGY